jgi:UDP-glucose 4-epimerase
MKIAITGGSGFIGTWLIREYGDTYDFYVLGRKPDTHELRVAGRAVPYLHTDYSVGNLQKQLSSADAVVHMAARRYGTNEQFSDYLPNISIGSNVFDACRAAGITNVVHLSSRSVYNNLLPTPWREEMRTVPSSYYGIAKLALETLAEHQNAAHGMKIKNLRVAQVVGTGEREGFMVMTFVRNALEKKPLTVFGSGTGRREYIYVRDVAGAIHAALVATGTGGTFNIGTGVSLSHRELADMVNRAFGNTGLQLLPDRPEDTSISLMDCSRAREILGWEARWSIEEGFRDMQELYTQEGP